MPNKIKSKPYEEMNYQMKDFFYDVLENAFAALKHEINGTHGWNRLIEDVNGVTMRKLGDDKIELTYHKIELGTPEVVIRHQEVADKFMDEVVKGLKKHYKLLGKKTLKLKKVGDDKDVQKYSRYQAESSSLYGSRMYGGQVGKFYIRYRRVYEISKPAGQQ
jgi:hypothetical protein